MKRKILWLPRDQNNINKGNKKIIRRGKKFYVSLKLPGREKCIALIVPIVLLLDDSIHKKKTCTKAFVAFTGNTFEYNLSNSVPISSSLTLEMKMNSLQCTFFLPKNLINYEILQYPQQGV